MKLHSIKIHLLTALCFFCKASFSTPESEQTWIRINLLGYTPNGVKVAVHGSRLDQPVDSFYLVDAFSGKIVFVGKTSKDFGPYGPFQSTQRLQFSKYATPGNITCRQVKPGLLNLGLIKMFIEALAIFVFNICVSSEVGLTLF